MMRVIGLDHVGLKARELEKTLDFYARLGLTVLRTSGPGADGVRSAVIQAGNQELNVFAHPDYGAEPMAQGRGVDHFCLLVSADSIQDVIEASPRGHRGCPGAGGAARRHRRLCARSGQGAGGAPDQEGARGMRGRRRAGASHGE